MKKSILFIHHGGSLGGAPLSMLKLAKSLKEEDYCVRVIFTADGPITDIADKMNVKYRVIQLRGIFAFGAHTKVRLNNIIKFLLFFIPDLFYTISILNKYKPDIIHLNTSVLIANAFAIKLYKKYLIWHVREVPSDLKLFRCFQVNIINKISDEIVITSNYLKKYYGNSNRTNVLYNWVSIKEYENLPINTRSIMRSNFNIKKNNVVIVMLGNVQEVKGHFMLAQASQKIIQKFPMIKIMIVSNQVDSHYKSSIKGKIKSFFNIPFDECHRLECYIKSLGLIENFIFTGWRNDIPQILSACDILLFLPQKPEGFGRPLIEAMASGLPIITTNIGPSSEICSENCAKLIPPMKESILADEIIELINDEPLRKEMGKKGKVRAKDRFSFKKLFPNFKSIYNSI